MTSKHLKAAAIACAIVGFSLQDASADQSAARTGDTVNGPVPGIILGGSTNVLVNGQPAARAGDTATCGILVATPGGLVPQPAIGTIVLGNLTVLINQMPAARLGDQLNLPNCTIVTGSPNVLF